MQVPTETDGPLTAFERVANSLPVQGFLARRRAAVERFGRVGYPTTKDPDWRKTDLRGLARVPFRPPEGPTPAPDAALVAAHAFPRAGLHEAVLVDGRPARMPARSPEGVRVRALDLAQDAALVGAVAEAGLPFVALNEAFVQGGVVVEVDAGVDVKTPVHVLHVHTGRATSTPRTVVVAGAGSRVHVLETFAGPEGVEYVCAPVTEIRAGDNAHVVHTKVQREGEAAWHVGSVHTAQGRDATVRQFLVSVGGAVVRNEVHSRFDGEGGTLELDGLFLERETQHMDNLTRIDHAKPHCASREVYKGILDGASRGVFDGKIVVRPGAQKTDAKQSNKNLLLSDAALVDSNPQLEIFADDVKCTHGSTTGQLDEDAVFYLRARGIGEEAARSLLTYAFARDITDRIGFDPLRQRIDDVVLARLPEGEAIRGALL